MNAACSLWLIQLGPTCLRMVPGKLCLQLAIKTCFIDATGQSDLGNSFVGFPSSQVTLGLSQVSWNWLHGFWATLLIHVSAWQILSTCISADEHRSPSSREPLGHTGQWAWDTEGKPPISFSSDPQLDSLGNLCLMNIYECCHSN